jgi:hypothetical protein
MKKNKQVNIVLFNKKLRVFLLTLFVTFLYSNSYSANYYVSTTGNDNNNGSIASPFRTIAKAASVVSAGDVVLITGGTYSEKNITPRVSGTEGNYIVFKPNPGTGNVIVKHPATSIDDRTPVFQLSNRNYIWIEGLQFKDFLYGLASIYISNGTGNVVINNRFENLGTSEVGAWNGNQMVGVFNSVRTVVYNNYFNNITGDGININSQNSEYNLVCYNTFLNFIGKRRSWGGTYLFSRAVDMQDMSNGNNVTAFNYAEDVVHHVWLDRDGSRNIILRNYGKGGSGNVFNESRCASNVIQENISVGMKVGYMSAYYSTTSDTYDPHIINNVCYNNEIGFRIHQSHRDIFRNNISFNNTDVNMEFSTLASSNGPHVFRNNLWFSSNKANSISYRGSDTSVPNFQSGVGETNGLSVNPQFVNANVGPEGFALQSSSPAKEAGDNGLDLGAYAYYGYSQFGWDASLSLSDIVVYFDASISRAERGEMHDIVIRLNKASSISVTVQLVPIAGDAIAGIDFSFIGGTTVTFNPGQTSKTISLQIGGSGVYDELVALKLENASNASVGPRCIHAIRFSPGSSTIFPTISITTPNTDITVVESATITLGAEVSNASGTITNVSFYANGNLIGSDNTSPYSIVWNETTPGTYIITAQAIINSINYTSSPRTVTITPPQGSYEGYSHPIPGKIELEHFDVGGNGFAYLDKTAGNTGGADFRMDEDVDIEDCSDEGNGYNLGWTAAGEWLEYTVNVETAGVYTLTFRVACNGENRTVSLSSDGNIIANNIAIPNTGGWQTWQDVVVPNLELPEGEQILRLTIGDVDYVNLNYMTFVSSAIIPPTVISPVVYCKNTNASELSATGTNLRWYTSATEGTPFTSTPIPSTENIGSTNYYVSQTLNNVESERAEIIVNVEAIPLAPTVVSPVYYSIDDQAIELIATGANLKWYSSETIETELTATPIPSTATIGTTNYYVSQTIGICESLRASIAVSVNDPTIQKIQLIAGWNIIGCPIIGGTNIEGALSSIWDEVEIVKNNEYYYDKSQSSFLNSLLELNFGQGYLVKVNTDCELDWIVR